MNHEGLYYDGEHARPVPVTWRVAGGELVIELPAGEQRHRIVDVRATSRLGSIRRVVQLPGGAQLHSDDNDAVDPLVSPRGIEAIADRLERHAGAVAASLLVTGAVAVWFLTLGLPWFADRAARSLPPEIEDAIGRQVIKGLEYSVLSETTLEPETQQHYRTLFDEFVADMPDRDRYRLAFRYMKGHPANAFALPGGTVVFTDALIELMEEDEEFLAVLAHELGHHRERHLLRSVLQSSAVAMLGMLVAGDVSGAGALMIGVPTFLLNNHYSRGFESEADRFAFARLKEAGISPAWFARIMARIRDDQPDADNPADKEGSLLSYASTHPPTDARVAAARLAGKDLPPPGRVIADRALEKLAAEFREQDYQQQQQQQEQEREQLEVDITADTFGEVPAVNPDVLPDCWSGTFTPDGDKGTAEWVERMDGDGTLAMTTTYSDGDVRKSRGFWALKGRNLVEHLIGLDAAGEEEAAGDTNRYRLVSATRDRLVYLEPESGDESEGVRVECPSTL